MTAVKQPYTLFFFIFSYLGPVACQRVTGRSTVVSTGCTKSETFRFMIFSYCWSQILARPSKTSQTAFILARNEYDGSTSHVPIVEVTRSTYKSVVNVKFISIVNISDNIFTPSIMRHQTYLYISCSTWKEPACGRIICKRMIRHCYDGKKAKAILRKRANQLVYRLGLLDCYEQYPEYDVQTCAAITCANIGIRELKLPTLNPVVAILYTFPYSSEIIGVRILRRRLRWRRLGDWDEGFTIKLPSKSDLIDIVWFDESLVAFEIKLSSVILEL